MGELPLPLLTGLLVALAVLSVLAAPRVRTAAGFFRGQDIQGAAPGVWTLTASQVTTWIFARSLMNAGILGFAFGVAGVLAYAAYYASFLTGAWIVDRLRFHHAAHNIQGFLHQRFGRLGTGSYNLLVSLRLLSEVFANLLVVGIIFGADGSVAYAVAILAVATVTLGYSMSGGLHASLRTDVLQFAILAGLLAVLAVLALGHAQFDFGAVMRTSGELGNPGWALLAVALLQVLSYPLHDPVMMDRGFLADRHTTRRSFIHAFWISALLILVFGMLGVFAGLHRSGEEALLDTLGQLLGTPAMVILAVALVVSAASTLDSTFSSAAKLAVVDMNLARDSAANGRLAMAAFALIGLFLVFTGTDDLFAAVAVSGTAALFLAPVIVFCIGLDRAVATWSYGAAVAAALGGATLYFLEDSGYLRWIEVITGVEHSYHKLLVITIAVLAIGFIAFGLGSRRAPKEAS